MKTFYIFCFLLLVITAEVNGFAISPPKKFEHVAPNDVLKGEIIIIGTEDEKIIINSPVEVKINPKEFRIQKGEIKTIDFLIHSPLKKGTVNYNIDFKSENSEGGISLQKQIIVPVSLSFKKRDFFTNPANIELKLEKYKEKTKEQFPVLSFFILILGIFCLLGWRYLYKRKQRL